ncbi:MAG TPA: G1 family glutamic endopeptidase [Candidatus Babeliales bacterium]|jgi:hypothetical protein|nr:G1 family glutamic endopeptidase [Candidatus Babeliales bacterium]
MKLMHVRNLLCVILLIFSPIVGAIDRENLTYIECELRLRERSSRKHQDDFKLTDAKNSSYASFTHPHIPVKEGTSQNWSGYVAVTNISKPKAFTVNAVYGSWVVPTLQSASHNTWCSMWVGIDGYSDSTVEQLGTEHDWYNGQQHDYAWFEMYPNYSYEITGFPVSPGDMITASVEYQDNNVFLLSIANITAGVHTTIPTSYTTSSTARRRSAEWVMEAPYSGGILPLSHFNTAYFSSCNATIGYMHGPINNKPWVNGMLTMVKGNGTVKAAPSVLSSGGQAFSVTWNHE